jgi:hypothetical protein
VFWLGYQKHAQLVTELDSTSSRVSFFFFSDVHVDPYYSDKPGDAEAGQCLVISTSLHVPFTGAVLINAIYAHNAMCLVLFPLNQGRVDLLHACKNLVESTAL